MKEKREHVREIIVEQLTSALASKLDEVTSDRLDENPLALTAFSMIPTAAGLKTAAGVGAGLAAALGGAAWWIATSEEEKARILAEVERSRVEEAFTIYNALKGMGTDEDEVIRMLSSKSSADIQADYAKVLVILDDYEEGGLVEWLRADGMDDQAEDLILRMAQGR